MAEWKDAYGPVTTYDSTGNGWVGYNLRLSIPTAQLAYSGSKIKVSLLVGAGEWRLSSMYIGHADANGNIDFDGNQVRVTWDGAQQTKNVTADCESDEITFALSKAKDALITLYFVDTNYDDLPYQSDDTTVHSWFKESADETATTDVSGYSDQAFRMVLKGISVYVEDTATGNSFWTEF